MEPDKAERLIAGAAAYGSQLVVFPEAFVGGYPHAVLFDEMTKSHATEKNEEYKKYHASAIDVPGEFSFRFTEAVEIIMLAVGPQFSSYLGPES